MPLGFLHYSLSLSEDGFRLELGHVLHLYAKSKT